MPTSNNIANIKSNQLNYQVMKNKTARGVKGILVDLEGSHGVVSIENVYDDGLRRALL